MLLEGYESGEATGNSAHILIHVGDVSQLGTSPRCEVAPEVQHVRHKVPSTDFKHGAHQSPGLMHGCKV